MTRTESGRVALRRRRLVATVVIATAAAVIVSAAAAVVVACEQGHDVVRGRSGTVTTGCGDAAAATRVFREDGSPSSEFRSRRAPRS